MKDLNILGVLDSISLYGKERANINVYYVLQQEGANVKVLCNKFCSDSMHDELKPFVKFLVPFPRNIVKKNFFSRFFLYCKNWVISNIVLLKLIKKNNIEFVLIPTEIALLYLYIPLFFTNVKVVLRLGDDPLSIRFKDNKLVVFYNFIWRNLIVNSIYHCVSISQYIQNNLILSGRMLTLKNSIIYNIPPKRKASVNVCSIEEDSKVFSFGFVGRIVKEKGVYELLLEAINLLKLGAKFKLFIAGDLDYDTQYSYELISLVNNSSFANSFIFMGELKDVISFYESIDVLCVPSIYNEPLSNVICEAKVYKKPSLILNRGGMPELVEHLMTGYICEAPSDLFKGLKFYIDNPLQCKIHGENAFNSIDKLSLGEVYFSEKWNNVFK